MAFEYMDEEFLPGESKNTIMEIWYITDEDKFQAKCEKLEQDAISVVKARVNIDFLKDQTPSPMPMLCESYVTSKLLDKFVNRADYEATAANHITNFWDTLNSLRETQQEEQIDSDEAIGKKIPPGIGVY